MRFLFQIVLNAVVLLGLNHFMDSINVSNFKVAIIAVVVLAIVNTIVRPIIKLLAFPITLLTLGLFLFVINGITFYLASLLVDGFEINGPMGAIIGAFIMSIFSTVINKKD